MFNPDDPTARYLGDGVYATFDGYQIWLHTNRGYNNWHRIALEPSVIASLLNYIESHKS